MKFFKDLVKEIFFIFAYPFGHIFGLFISKSPTDPKQTIVIVERWFTTHPYHKFWKNYLEKQGFEVYIVNFPIYKGSFEESAVKLKEYIDNLSLENIVLAGISSGALTSLLYLQHHKGWDKTKKFIALGAPFKGTYMSSLISFTKSGRQLLPTSMLIKKLTDEKIVNKDKIICLRAKHDEMVPSDSSFIDGTKCETVEISGHNNFHLDSKDTYSLVAKYAKD